LSCFGDEKSENGKYTTANIEKQRQGIAESFIKYNSPMNRNYCPWGSGGVRGVKNGI
jgi:hypothetical protein